MFIDEEVELGKSNMFTLYGSDYQFFFRESDFFNAAQ